MIDLSQYFLAINHRKQSDQTQIFCLIRKKWLVSTPEEVVRQTAISHLIDLGYSPQLIAVEKQIKINQLSKRFDIAVANTQGDWKILVECKAPKYPVDQNAIDQVSLYNTSLQVPILWITNGVDHKIYKIDTSAKSYKVLDTLPAFKKTVVVNDQSWSNEQFLGFLLLHASHADYDYSKDEKENILKMISLEDYEIVEQRFQASSDYEQLNLIQELKEHFANTTPEKQKIFEQLEQHFKSDGDFSRPEEGLLLFLKKLL